MHSNSKLFQESIAYKPFEYDWAFEFRRKHENIHWTSDEISLDEDSNQWKGNILKVEEKEHITSILKLFTQLDVVVGRNYVRFLQVLKNNEIAGMLASNLAREFEHQRAYALLNDTLGLPESDYKAFLEYQEMSDKLDYMLDNDFNTIEGLALSIAKSVFNEGVSLFAAFAMLLNYVNYGKMKGMCKIVEWSIRDEDCHCECMVKLFRTYCGEYPHIVNDSFKKKIYDMSRKVYELEELFINLVYKDISIEGLSSQEVKNYVKYISDMRLIQLGMKPNFGVKKNPLLWIDNIVNGRNHSNFFETRVTDYVVSGMTGEWKY